MVINVSVVALARNVAGVKGLVCAGEPLAVASTSVLKRSYRC
jgi:hypothetical protein